MQPGSFPPDIEEIFAFYRRIAPWLLPLTLIAGALFAGILMMHSPTMAVPVP